MKARLALSLALVVGSLVAIGGCAALKSLTTSPQAMVYGTFRKSTHMASFDVTVVPQPPPRAVGMTIEVHGGPSCCPPEYELQPATSAPFQDLWTRSFTILNYMGEESYWVQVQIKYVCASGEPVLITETKLFSNIMDSRRMPGMNTLPQ